MALRFLSWLHLSVWMALSLGVISPVLAEPSAPIDPLLKPYIKISGVSGAINSIGSDTLNNLMTLWAEGFRRQYPNVKIQVEARVQAQLLPL